MTHIHSVDELTEHDWFLPTIYTLADLGLVRDYDSEGKINSRVTGLEKIIVEYLTKSGIKLTPSRK